MLGKLLKYDFKFIFGNILIFYILAIFFALLTRVLSLLEYSIMVDILYKISTGCFISMIANILINAMMSCWVRFRRSLYKDESYLTHTLPVTKNQLYNSKFISTFIFFLISFIVIIIGLFIAYYTPENWNNIINVMNMITVGYNMSSTFFVLIALLIIFLEIFNAIQCGYLGIILGHRKNNAKIGFSILFGFIAYLISQSLVLGLVYVYGFIDPSVMALFESVTINIDANAFKVLAIASSAFYILIICIMYFMNKKFLNKGVDVE